MKKVYIILTISTAFILAGCSESFLELSPITENNVENFYRNSSDFEQATIAIYQSYSKLDVELLRLNETRSDNAFHQAANTDIAVSDIDLFNTQPDNRVVENLWTRGFQTVYRANIVISRLEGVDFDQDLKNQYRGEALFMRAIAYFDLTNAFGDVPLPLAEVKSPSESFQFLRESRRTVLNQLRADLEEAATLLPLKSGVAAGRASQGAAYALLGKVLLTLDEFEEAEAVLSQISGFSLLLSYGEVFAAENENNDESIFEMQYIENLAGSLLAVFSVPALREQEIYGSSAAANTGGGITPTESLLNSYEVGDQRRYQGFDTLTFSDGIFETWTAKGTNGPVIQFTGGDNKIILRYADVLLMRAEALSQRGQVNNAQALELVNQVRRRAFGVDINTPNVNVDLSSLDADALLLARRRELALEGYRWPDLIRYDKAIEVMAAEGFAINENQLVYPIPQREINTNPDIIQNPGY